MSDSLRSALGRAAYAFVVWLLAFSALEQFEGLNDDFRLLGQSIFHYAAFSIAVLAALFEAATLRGLSGLRNFWERPDPIPGVANRSCIYRAARLEDLRKVRKLAVKRYGWAFKLKQLRRWHLSNPRCLFLMLSEGELVGYVDAFPITAADYESLLAGRPEHLITPLREDAVDATCSFYIASVVIADGWGALLPALLKRAMTFYGRSYTDKRWIRLCAIGYSPEGRTLLERKQAQPLLGDNVKVQMYTIDRSMLPRLSKTNRALWSKLLPTPPTALP